MKARTLFLALVAVLSLLSATAVAGGHRVVQGTKGGDELNMTSAGDRVFARSGDDTVDGGAGNDRLRGGHGDDALFGGDGKDRLRGGQDNDLLDGGDGNDYLNGGGDGRDKDRIVCGDGYDVVVLGRGDVVLVEVEASGNPEEGELEAPESGDDGCEKVKRPGGGQEACPSTRNGCDEPACPSMSSGCDEPVCPSMSSGCEDPADDVCPATYRGCDDPVVEDEPVEEPADEPDQT